MLLPFGCFTFASCEEVNETCNTLSTPTNTHENTRQLARGVLLSGEGQVCGMRPVITAPHVDCWFSPPSSPWTRSFFTHTSIQLYISTSVFLCHSLGLLIHEHSKTHNIVTFHLLTLVVVSLFDYMLLKLYISYMSGALFTIKSFF